MTEQTRLRLTEHLERCLTQELESSCSCVEVLADKLAENWAEAGSVGRTFSTPLAYRHSRWVLKHDKALEARYLSARKARVA